jgi:uncharacterized damage-inducible protein DinB
MSCVAGYLVEDTRMTFPRPTVPYSSQAEIFLGYLDFFRSRVIEKVYELDDHELRQSRLPSGWTPLELVKHLIFVEVRWIEWSFQGRDVGDPWGDRQGDRWHVAPEETRDELVARLRAQGAHTQAVVSASDLAQTSQPSPRWEGAEPPSLERILFHMVQEYARHLGHLDIVTELAGGATGH